MVNNIDSTMFKSLIKTYKKRFGADKQYYQIIDDVFGFCPYNIELYKMALIHCSASLEMEDGTPINNERLEFLGDAVLDTIVSDYLYIEFPHHDEGFLTQMRSKIVSRQTLNELCTNIGLNDYVISQAGGNFIQKHLYGDALEAMIGAIYLDKGYDFANRLVIKRILNEFLDLYDIKSTETDYKSRLIEWCQKSKHTISFETDFSDESTAQNPIFKSIAIIDEMEVGYGMGHSKKEAEQMASYTVSQAMSEEMGDSFMEWVDERLRTNGLNNEHEEDK